MNGHRIIEPIGFLVALITFFFSLLLFYSDNSMFLGSITAAALASALAWTTYIILRWMLIAIRK